MLLACHGHLVRLVRAQLVKEHWVWCQCLWYWDAPEIYCEFWEVKGGHVYIAPSLVG
jgi:hypothetical protein